MKRSTVAAGGSRGRFQGARGVAVKSVPVPFEDALTQAQLQQVYGR
jgi:hypothetical protein